MRLLTFLMVVILAGCGSTTEEVNDDGLTEAQIRRLDAITTLGYVMGTNDAPATDGVTINEPEAYQGYTLFTSRDRPVAFLVDMEGTVVKTWHAPYGFYWPRVNLQPDGSLIVLASGPPSIMQVEQGGRVLWRTIDLYHHDVHVTPDGRIFTLVREWVERPELHALPVAEDFIAELDMNGNEVRRVSLLNAFTRSPIYRNWLDVLKMDPGDGKGCDLFHTNSLQMYEDGGKLYALVSIRNISVIAIIDMESEFVTWAMAGMWRKQHEARWTDRGIILFDNLGHAGISKVIEFDPLTQEVLWQYDSPEFFSKGCGSQQILPNGNVLITESFYGRIFEVTRAGRIVWEYYNTFRTEDGKIVRLLRARRFGEGEILPAPQN